MIDRRITAAESLLRELGIPGRVTADGDDATIATIAVHPDRWPALTGPAGRAVAARIRGLGFRYVAIDLAAPANSGAAPPDTDDHRTGT